MSVGVLNAAMLVGLAGAALPVIIHLLNRRRDTVIDWGAMQFLEMGRSARRKVRLSELLLLLVRISLLALAALALSRPFVMARTGAADLRNGSSAPGTDAPGRDVVLVIDSSASMERRLGGTTPRARAIEWARRFVKRSRPGDTIAVLVAGHRVRRLIDPPSFDAARVDEALAAIPPARGRSASDLPAVLVEAFHILERTQNPDRLIVVLSDGQQYAWRPGESGRWSLVRELHRRLPVPPTIWSIAWDAGESSGPPNASLGPLELSRRALTPRRPVVVTTTVANAGPGSTTRTAELLIDGQPTAAAAQTVGPIPAGSQVPLRFRTAIAAPGSHVLTVRLDGLDPLAIDDESSIPVHIAPALPVLLVEGAPGSEPFRGATDFLRAALAPTGDDTPPVRARVIGANRLNAGAVRGQRVVVLADLDRLSTEQVAGLDAFVDTGGGILVLPGGRTDARTWNDLRWMPARLDARIGEAADHKSIAHPAPRTFLGPWLSPFGESDDPPLSGADVFTFRRLIAAPGASVLARLDTGDPWIVERSVGRGRVAVVAVPFDADSSMLPVNPDFVPMAHELIDSLAGGVSAPIAAAGEPLVFPLEQPAPPGARDLAVETPGGGRTRAIVIRGEAEAHAQLNDPTEAGVYRLMLPDPPGGSVYAAVVGDEHESDMTPLDRSEAANLARGWPLEFSSSPEPFEASLAAPGPGGKHEMWRVLVVAVLVLLCAEVFLTRRIVLPASMAVRVDEAPTA